MLKFLKNNFIGAIKLLARSLKLITLDLIGWLIWKYRDKCWSNWK